MGEVRVGCSGFSYDDWVGRFYPDRTSAPDYLRLYAREFDTVEINSTYYRIPSPRTTRGWVERTDADFLFSVKAHQSMTHEPKEPSEAVSSAPVLLSAVSPIVEAGRLGCILMQFPWSFRPTHQARDILEALIGALQPLPLVCEFRHVEWSRDSVKRWLSTRGVGYCCVDQPALDSLMPREVAVTSSIGYLRFHGRNRAKWFHHEHAWERYDYLYTREELEEWVDGALWMAERCDRLLVYFNNHRMGQAPANALLFRELLASAG